MFVVIGAAVLAIVAVVWSDMAQRAADDVDPAIEQRALRFETLATVAEGLHAELGREPSVARDLRSDRTRRTQGTQERPGGRPPNRESTGLSATSRLRWLSRDESDIRKRRFCTEASTVGEARVPMCVPRCVFAELVFVLWRAGDMLSIVVVAGCMSPRSSAQWSIRVAGNFGSASCESRSRSLPQSSRGSSRNLSPVCHMRSTRRTDRRSALMSPLRHWRMPGRTGRGSRQWTIRSDTCIGSARARRARYHRPRAYFPPPERSVIPDVEPKLPEALKRLTRSQRTSVVLVHALGVDRGRGRCAHRTVSFDDPYASGARPHETSERVGGDD